MPSLPCLCHDSARFVGNSKEERESKVGVFGIQRGNGMSASFCRDQLLGLSRCEPGWHGTGSAEQIKGLPTVVTVANCGKNCGKSLGRFRWIEAARISMVLKEPTLTSINVCRHRFDAVQ